MPCFSVSLPLCFLATLRDAAQPPPPRRSPARRGRQCRRGPKVARSRRSDLQAGAMFCAEVVVLLLLGDGGVVSMLHIMSAHPNNLRAPFVDGAQRALRYVSSSGDARSYSPSMRSRLVRAIAVRAADGHNRAAQPSDNGGPIASDAPCQQPRCHACSFRYLVHDLLPPRKDLFQRQIVELSLYHLRHRPVRAKIIKIVKLTVSCRSAPLDRDVAPAFIIAFGTLCGCQSAARRSSRSIYPQLATSHHCHHSARHRG